MKATHPLSLKSNLVVMTAITPLSCLGVYVLSGKGPRQITGLSDEVASLLFLASILFGLVTPFLVLRLLVFSKVLFGKESALLKSALVTMCLLALVPSVMYYGMMFKIFTGSL